MNKKIIVTTSAIAAMAVNVFANPVVQGPVEPNTVSPTATGYNSIVGGVNSQGNGTNNIVLGRDNVVNGSDTTVIGGGNGTIGNGETTVIGYNNVITGTDKEITVIGSNNTATGQGAFIAGTHTVSSAVDAVAVGNNAIADVSNAVALGTNSVTELPNPSRQIVINNTTHVFAGDSPDSVVSVGTRGRAGYGGVKYYTRQITNVAAGQVEADSLDAINGSQLYAVADEVNINGNNIATNTKVIANNTKAINDLSKVTDSHNKVLANHESRIQTLESTDKAIKSDVADTQKQVNINTKDIADLKGQISADTTAIKNELNNKINATQQRINKLGASSAALSGLHPLDFNRNDKASYAVSYGHYRNANAVALGAFYRPNERTMYGVGVTLGGETQLTINAAFKVGKGSDYLAEAKTENGRIAQLEKLVQALTDEVAALKNK